MTTIMIATALALIAQKGPAEPVASVTYRPSVTLQLAVSSLDRSIRFYEDVMGFKVTERRDDLQFAHVQTSVPGLELGLNQVQGAAPSAAVVINFSVVDVAVSRHALETKGVKFPRPTQVIPGKVSLAEFADPDGHRLRLAGPAPKPDDIVR